LRKLIVLALVVVLVTVMSAPAALFATGNNNGGNGDCKKDRSGKCEYKKVRICHIPPGNPDNKHVISVSQNALQAHLDHGDFVIDKDHPAKDCKKKNNGKKNNGKKDNGKKNNGKKH
jgi:hypothetical protein